MKKKEVEGIIIRSRARWYEHGERSSKYFLNLEKRNHVKNHIRKLDINAFLTTDPLKILHEQKRFYQELYQSINRTSNNSERISLFLDNLNIPKLSETDKNSCEGKISAGECYKLLDKFQNNKTPGNDGIPNEFYKKFWSLTLSVSRTYLRILLCLTPKDFTLSNARRFYSSKGNPLTLKGLKNYLP